MVMLNVKQIEALKKLAAASAIQNAPGAALGVAKHGDGTTLNGNMIRSLEGLGLIESVETGETRNWRNRDTGRDHAIKVVRFQLTAAGLAAVKGL